MGGVVKMMTVRKCVVKLITSLSGGVSHPSYFTTVGHGEIAREFANRFGFSQSHSGFFCVIFLKNLGKERRDCRTPSFFLG